MCGARRRNCRPRWGAKKFEKRSDIASVKRIIATEDEISNSIFPGDPKKSWNRDQLGPIYIPKEGKTIPLNAENISFYKRIIEVYEGSEMGIENKVSTNGTQVLINGEPAKEYTFKQNYYWMMGDNRHNSHFYP